MAKSPLRYAQGVEELLSLEMANLAAFLAAVPILIAGIRKIEQMKPRSWGREVCVAFYLSNLNIKFHIFAFFLNKSKDWNLVFRMIMIGY